MRTVVIFDDFIPFALSWQWTQRPAGDSMKDMKELLNHSFKTRCQRFLFFSGLISIKGWKLKRLLTYKSTWKSSYTGTVKIRLNAPGPSFSGKENVWAVAVQTTLHPCISEVHGITEKQECSSSTLLWERREKCRDWELGANISLAFMLISEKIFWLWSVILLLLSAYLKLQLLSNTASSHSRTRIKSEYLQGMKVSWLSNGQ